MNFINNHKLWKWLKLPWLKFQFYIKRTTQQTAHAHTIIKIPISRYCFVRFSFNHFISLLTTDVYNFFIIIIFLCTKFKVKRNRLVMSNTCQSSVYRTIELAGLSCLSYFINNNVIQYNFLRTVSRCCAILQMANARNFTG